MKIDVFSDFNKQLEEVWIEFEKDAIMTPFQCYFWLKEWQNSIGYPLLNMQLQIVHIYHGDTTFAILPMGISKKFGARVLQWLGGINSDYLGLLINADSYSSNGLNDIWKDIEDKLNKYDIIHLQKQSQFTVNCMKKIGFHHKEINFLKSYKVKLSDTWDEHSKRINKKIRNDSIRQEKRLKNIVDLSYKSPKEINLKTELVNNMILQKKMRYKQINTWDMFSLDGYKDFYLNLVDVKSHNVEIHCAALYANNTMIASHFGLIDKTTFFYLMPAHIGGKWSKYSPGRLLLLELMKFSIEKGLKYFDFTVGGEMYKKKFCDLENNLFEYIKINSPFGIMYFVVQKLKLLIKKIGLKK